MKNVVVEPASASDLPSLARLVRESGLPTEGIESHLHSAFVARERGNLVGSVVLELYGRAALMRSVAVHRDMRGRGLGTRLVKAALARAQQEGVGELYLLTENATLYFLNLGFQPVERKKVPLSLRESLEFTVLCPMTAVAMRLRLTGQV